MSPRWLVLGLASVLVLAGACAGTTTAAHSPSASPAGSTAASQAPTSPCNNLSVTADVTSPIVAGTQVSATAQSPCPMVEYRFQLVDLSTGVGLVMQGWGTSNTWTWDTTGSQVGRFAIEADVRSAGGTGQNPDASTRVEVDVVHSLPSGPASGKCTVVTVKSSTSSPVAAGTLVTATAQASGCQTADYRFQLVSLDNGVGVVMQDWGTSSTWTWDTTNVQAGSYAIRADARGITVASQDPDATAQVEIDVVHGIGGAHCTSVSLPTSTTLPVHAGTPVTATALASGCTSPDYRFQLVDLVSGVGLVMQDWGTSNTWTWDTTGSHAGRYAIRVDVRGAGVASQNPDATTEVEVDIVGS